MITLDDTTSYNLNAFVISYDTCRRTNYRDTVQIRLVVLPEPNTNPITSSSLTYNPVEGFIGIH